MRHNYFFTACLSIFLCYHSSIGFTQGKISGVKPKISINGIVWAIENQQFSCTTRYCDSIVIEQGDSIRFCTDANIDLASDTAYYMQWNFTGSNYSTAVFDTTPSSLPICYSPAWSTPGTYTVDVFYNGWLSAYPGRDCYSYGPSHWSVNIIVLAANGISTIQELPDIKIFPNPVRDIITIESNKDKTYNVKITNLMGATIKEGSFTGKGSIRIPPDEKGLLLLEIYDENGMFLRSKKIAAE